MRTVRLKKFNYKTKNQFNFVNNQIIVFFICIIIINNNIVHKELKLKIHSRKNNNNNNKKVVTSKWDITIYIYHLLPGYNGRAGTGAGYCIPIQSYNI